MKTHPLQKARPEFIAAVVAEDGRAIGRTAVMKLSYLLQTLRKVPLGYRFSLYTYGPFDHEVLSDLTQAENQKLVKSTLVEYANGGYGYEIKAKPQKAKGVMEPYRADVQWVLDKFGACSAGELEMFSTIIFVDRSVKQRNEVIGLTELVRKVRGIKPHIAQERMEREARRLKEEGLLLSVV